MAQPPRPLETDFEAPTVLPHRPGLSVVFKPTRTVYVFTTITDPPTRSRIGPLASDCEIHRGLGTNVSGYDEAEVQKMARALALAAAERLLSRRELKGQ
jgi:hypothetical protein